MNRRIDIYVVCVVSTIFSSILYVIVSETMLSATLRAVSDISRGFVSQYEEYESKYNLILRNIYNLAIV